MDIYDKIEGCFIVGGVALIVICSILAGLAGHFNW